MMITRPPIAFMMLACATLAADAQDCSLPELAEIYASDAAHGDWFGEAIAASEDTLVVGAAESPSGLKSGSVYVFSLPGLNQQAKLFASDGAAGDEFGSSVAVYGNMIVVGAPRDTPAGANSGSIYVFHRFGSVWFETAKLAPSSPGPGTSFGSRVACEGSTVVAVGGGVVYVFEQQSGGSWIETSALTPLDGGGFGSDVSLSGNTLAIGRVTDADTAPNSGAVYVFDRPAGGLFVQTAKLKAPNPTTGEQIGRPVGISGDLLVTASIKLDGLNVDTGAALTYRRTAGQWSFDAQLQSPDSQTNDWFGRDAEILGSRVLVSAPEHDSAIANSGAAYIFERSPSGWDLIHKCHPSDPYASGDFGYAVALTSSLSIIGDRWDGDHGGDNGSVYVFTGSALDSYQIHGAPCPGSGGFSPQLSMKGCPVGGGSVTTMISGALGGSMSAVLVGASEANASIGSGGCTLLVANTIPIAVVLPLFGAGPGSGSVSVSAKIPAGLSGSFVAQAFIADPANAIGFCVTNAVKASIQ